MGDGEGEGDGEAGFGDGGDGTAVDREAIADRGDDAPSHRAGPGDRDLLTDDRDFESAENLVNGTTRGVRRSRGGP